MFVVGVTGGIGCGKTAVTDYLAKKGIVIADADQAARVVVMPGKPALSHIAEHFGEHLIQDDGHLDRRGLRDIIFNNESERTWLETLLHPLIFEQLDTELNQADSPYVVLVSPLLVETSQHQLANRVLVIDVAEETQITRAMARDNISREQAEAILRTQSDRQNRLDKADDIVDNSSTLEQLYKQLDTLHESYLELAASC